VLLDERERCRGRTDRLHGGWRSKDWRDAQRGRAAKR
jgi:hypothetical protein